jgi:hypothetical protein
MKRGCHDVAFIDHCHRELGRQGVNEGEQMTFEIIALSLSTISFVGVLVLIWWIL